MICIAVKYQGPTNTRGTRYTATMANWQGEKLRATVGYDYAKNTDDNQLAAVFAVLDKSRKAWGDTHAWRRMMEQEGMRWRVKCAGEHPTTGEMIFGAALVDAEGLEA